VGDEQKREEKRRRSEKYLEIQFDFLKHLTTLNSAITVVVLAVYQTGKLSGLVFLSLVFFGASLIVALASMYTIMLNLMVGSVRERIPWEVLWSGSLFFGGLVAFAYFALAGG